MQSSLITHHETHRFREIISGIKAGTLAEDEKGGIATQLLALMGKYSASYPVFDKMASLLVENAETIFPFIVFYSNDELLKVLSESRAGKSLSDRGIKGILKRRFTHFNPTETLFILFLEYYCNCCVSTLGNNKTDKKLPAWKNRIDEIQILITNIRSTFETVASSELTIDKAVRMIQSICEDISNTDKDIQDILSGKGRFTLCTTRDSEEARYSAGIEEMEYITQDGQLIFSMRIGIDVNMEVEATPKMCSLLRKYAIDFVENKETSKYVLDFQQYKSPADFTFEQMINLKPCRNYFPKAIHCDEKTVVPEGTFAQVVAYDSSGKIQTYIIPPPIR